MSIEITVVAKGQTQIPDQTQLRGCYLDGVTCIPPNVASFSPVTGSSNVAAVADLQAMTLSLQRASDNVQQYYPILGLSPFNDGGATPGQLLREYWLSQQIDWNQSLIVLATAPSQSPIIVSLGIYYYNPVLDIQTDNAQLVNKRGKYYWSTTNN
jgi:hypothetical protein